MQAATATESARPITATAKITTKIIEESTLLPPFTRNTG